MKRAEMPISLYVHRLCSTPSMNVLTRVTSC
jgi:hypothetical protein